jgi:hypothetical protein
MFRILLFLDKYSETTKMMKKSTQKLVYDEQVNFSRRGEFEIENIRSEGSNLSKNYQIEPVTWLQQKS